MFGFAIFSGAFLLFQVQPLIGKYILPWFGGSPGVWATCILFFQTVLLFGYAYAYASARWLKPRTQVLLHLALVLAALAFLPITPAESWKPTGANNPVLSILGLLAVTLGLPYLVLSATAPLVQNWLGHTNPQASVYRLYALSNLASLLALLSYPAWFETHFSRRAQALFWGWGLAFYAFSVALCAWRVWRLVPSHPGSADDASVAPAANEVPSSAARTSSVFDRALWLLLPCCASALLLATTNKICEDVASIPFLWVLPLVLYLLSFIICFETSWLYRREPFAFLLVVGQAGVCSLLFADSVSSIPAQIAVYCFALFVCSMVCHGELYRLRPPLKNLTTFYLSIAAGGALGGLFVVVIAPLIFNDYFELHWGLLSCGLLLVVLWFRGERESGLKRIPLGLSLVFAAYIIGLVIALWMQATQSRAKTVSSSRNFYGVLKVLREIHPFSKIECLELVHGNISHGMQLQDAERSSWRTAYYSENSGAGLALSSLSESNRTIGLIGLGVGTLASYARPGDHVRAYEINPEVYNLADSRFTFLKNCQGDLQVILGDARLSLEREPPQNFDMLALDAFSSDAIPIHLLTEEAFAIYRRHLKPAGIIAIHISNNLLDLEPIVGNLGNHFGFSMATVEHVADPSSWWVRPSRWVLLSQKDSALQNPSIASVSRRVRFNQRTPFWTDDFASLFPVVRWADSQQGAIAEAQAAQASAFWQQGDYAGAAVRYRAALNADPDYWEVLNDFAWLLATTSDSSVRNGAEAVLLAEKACRLTLFQRPITVGTLAAAYAEAGRFRDAVEAAEKACSLAAAHGEEGPLAKNKELLGLYKSGKPYHEPAPSSSGSNASGNGDSAAK